MKEFEETSIRRTSIKTSLCRRTPERMLATVIAANITRDPTMKPWGHASSVTAAGEDGFGIPSSGEAVAMLTGYVEWLRPACALGC